MLKFKITSKDGLSIAEYFGESSMIEQIKGWIDPQFFGLPERPELDAEGNPTGVMLPAEYTVEITDITAEHELQECIKNRKAEYPSPEEFMNAYFDGGEAALQALNAARLAVKQKYPKPSQGEN